MQCNDAIAGYVYVEALELFFLNFLICSPWKRLLELKLFFIKHKKIQNDSFFLSFDWKNQNIEMHVPMTHGWCDNIRVTSARVLTSSEMPKLRKNPRYFITHLGQQTEESQGWTKIIFSLRMMGFGVAKWSALAI